MAIVVTVYQAAARRSQVIAQAMARGIRHAGDGAVVREEASYTRPDSRVAVFYGLQGNLARVLRDYVAAGLTAVYIDLGYWRRKEPTVLAGYHKIAVNARHPTAYFMRKKHDARRINALGVRLKPWRAGGREILLAGMGDKAAAAEGYDVEQWETEAIRQLQLATDRPIIYRPKPSYPQARPLAGAGYSPPSEGLDRRLARCHAVVTHHSNVAVDGLVEGVPAFCLAGVAVPMSLADLGQIETPFFPGDRQQWLNAIAYCQWSVPEMSDGLAWRHLKDQGLVP